MFCADLYPGVWYKESNASEGNLTMRAVITCEALPTRLAQCRGNVLCRDVRVPCFRCLQPKHRKRDCFNIKSVQQRTERESRCRECFLSTLRGNNIHSESESGRNGACPFSRLMQLALICFSEDSIRSHLLSFVNNESLNEPGRVKNARDFSLWLQIDTAENCAGIFKATNYLIDLLIQVVELFCDS